jgi:hypothetical protein
MALSGQIKPSPVCPLFGGKTDMVYVTVAPKRTSRCTVLTTYISGEQSCVLQSTRIDDARQDRWNDRRTPPTNDTTLHVIEGDLSPSHLTQFARAHDEAGFDLALVGHTSSSVEGFLVALYAAGHTNRLGYLVAHRPGFVAPTLMARKIATFDHLTSGRLAVHIITGKTDEEQRADGDFSPKARALPPGCRVP